MIKFLLSLLFIGLVFSPFYVFSSGLPQPSDFILITFALLTLFYALYKNVFIHFAVMPYPWRLLVLWITVVIVVWTFIMQSPNFLRDILFWIYNFFIISSMLFLLVVKPEYKKYVVLAIQIALIISGIGAILSLGTAQRPTGFFNNPNQLAFYSLCGLAVLQGLNKGFLSSSILNISALLMGAAGIFTAASLAAMSGFFALILAHFIATKNFKLLMQSVLATSVVMFVVFFLNLQIVAGISDNVQKRLLKVDQKVEDISEERNYERIVLFPEYTIFGAGEAHRERFYPHHIHEIHSSFGNLLFSYGIIGISLFILLLFRLALKLPIAVVVVLFAPLLYSITHMGLRTTMFWVFIGLLWYEYHLKPTLDSNRSL